MSKLSDRIGLNRNTFTIYLFFLQEANLTRNIYKDASGITLLQKPDKIYLENTNFQYALAPKNTEKGSIRETFFVNQLSYQYQVEYVEQGDFLIDQSYTIEVGGGGKTKKQIQGIPNSYIASDDLEYGTGTKIPLWMFGFLY